MRAEYKRDMNHNYLILRSEENLDTDSYPVRMLVSNIMPSLLKCRIQSVDGEHMVYYDITSRQSLVSMYEEKKFGMEDLRFIYGSFIQVIEEMEEYLLDSSGLIFFPEYMYLDVEKKQLSYCFLPGYSQDVREQLQALTEYILPKLDHEDSRAVTAGYGIYRHALADSLQMEVIKAELYSSTPPEKEKTGSGRQAVSKEESAGTRTDQKGFADAGSFSDKSTFSDRSSLSDRDPFSDLDPFSDRDVFSNKDSDSNGDKCKAPREKEAGGLAAKLLLCCLVAVILAGLVAAKYFGYLPGITMTQLLGGIVAAIGVGMLAFLLLHKNGDASAEIADDPAAGTPVLETPEEKFMPRYQEQPAEDSMCQYADKPVESMMPPCTEQPVKSQQQSLPKPPARQKAGEYGETVVLSAAPVQGPASFVSREPGELATIYLQEDITVIGKMETAADAVLDLPTVSRMHAKVRRRDGEYYLTDLNSRNGTSVNGRLLQEGEDYCLQPMDEVDFAQARFVFLK